MCARILPVFVASLALLSSITSAAAREPQVEAREPQQSEIEEALLLAEGELEPYLDDYTRRRLYNRGMERSAFDNLAWQSFCSDVYAALANPTPILTPVPVVVLGGTYSSCMDIASSNSQTKQNWLRNAFGEF
jgi:hypothetical protein